MISEQSKILLFLLLSIFSLRCYAENILGCGGFLKSHADIDFSKVQIKLYTKTGSLKDQTECAPNSGYYFLPLYDRGEYILKVEPPRGWSFEPTEVALNVDGTTDDCSQEKDINFAFKGFGITGRVISLGSNSGPKDVTVTLYNESNKKAKVGTTLTAEGGTFYFTPIQPGKYVLVASHPSWLLKADTVEVTVQEGNTELPDGSLVIYGYDVSGRITSKDEPVSGVSYVLFGNGVVKNCATTPITKELDAKKPLCHVTSDKSGKFVFPSVSPGTYKLVPLFVGAQTKLDIEPPEVSFKVSHGSVTLKQDFKVTGFTVSGLVRTAINGKPLADAKIFLSQKHVATTDADGKYVLDNMKTGQYTLRAESENLQFDEKTLKVSLNSPELPILIPAAYKVCGKVSLSNKDSLTQRIVTIRSTAGTSTKDVETDIMTGEYCTYLSPDVYELSVVVSTEERTKGLQFFPLQKTISVTTQPITDVNFLQLKATLTGSVVFLNGADSSQVSVTLKMTDGLKIKTIQAKGGEYEFTDVLPGHYEVLIDNDLFCWKVPSYTVSITSERAEVPAFQQTGFSVTFISSHKTLVEYFNPSKSKKDTLVLDEGTTKHCLPVPGTYNFTPVSCHIFEKDLYTWETVNPSPVLLHSTEHSHKGTIVTTAPVEHDTLKMTVVNAEGHTIIIPVVLLIKEDAHTYEFEFKAKTDNTYTLKPSSDILLFTPPSLKVLGVNDCHNDIAQFHGHPGKFINGKVDPQVEGVIIRIFGKDKETPLHTTYSQKDGTYSVGPLDGNVEYSVTAEAEGFGISGPDANGVFVIRYLAVIIVQVFDGTTKAPLQGVLLSLSAGQSYRKNSITGEDGKFVFNSLLSGEYYLRPMMKEYRFDPPSKVIKLEESYGLTEEIKLYGTRIAFSAYGTVTSLNGEPEAGLLVEVQGQGDCSNLQEEATTEENGNFRIRGLQPTCAYEFRLKPNADANAHIQRTSPSSIPIQTSEDIHGLRLIAFHPITRTDVSVHVVATQPEHYRSLKVKLCREDAPDLAIHTSKLDTQHSGKNNQHSNAGYLIHLPPLPTDGRKYFIQLESSLSQSLHKYRTIPVYFEANSSFKYVKLLFNAERKVDQADMNQTSIVALPFMMLVGFAFLNRDKLWAWLNTLVESWSKPAPSPRVPVQSIPIDPRADDIIVEQIMNINKRKTKPRKA